MTDLGRLLVPVLVNALWQIPLLVLAGRGIARLLRRAPAAHLHGLWLGVLVLATILPWASPFLVPVGEPGTPPGSRWGGFLLPLGGIATEAGAERAAGGLASASAGPGSGVAALLAVYAALVAAAALRLAVAARRAARLRRKASPLAAGEAVAASAARLARALGARPPELLVCSRVSGPLTLGVRRPAILLPPWLVRQSRGEDLEAVLGHELAHVARRDCAVNLAAELLLLPFAAHPASWWLRRELARSREMACDEAAAAALRGRRAYARTLYSLAVTLSAHPRTATATLGALDADTLEERMRRLVDDTRRFTAAAARWALAGGLAVLALAAWTAAGLAVPAAADTPAADLASFAGVWRGDYDQGEGRNMPAATLTVTLAGGEPRVALLMYRHLKRPDGSIESVATGFPVVSQGMAGGRLAIRTRDDNFSFRGGPRESVEYEWAFEVTAPGRGRLILLSNSRFLAEKDHGRKVPPPPPPIEMKRDA